MREALEVVLGLLGLLLALAVGLALVIWVITPVLVAIGGPWMLWVGGTVGLVLLVMFCLYKD